MLDAFFGLEGRPLFKSTTHLGGGGTMLFGVDITEGRLVKMSSTER